VRAATQRSIEGVERDLNNISLAGNPAV